MKKTLGIIVVLYLAITSVFEISAQEKALSKLTLDDQYAKNVFNPKGINSI